MKAIKAMGTVDEKGQLILDSPLISENPNTRVEVIVLIPESAEAEKDNQTKEGILNDLSKAWHEAINGQTIPIKQIWSDQNND